MSNLEILTRDFHTSLQQCGDICQFIERGQAHTPLADIFQQLEQSVVRKPLGITLLCLTPEAKLAALKWLYGHNFALFSLEVSNQIGLLEVHLKERGYSYENSTGERQDFDRWEQLLEAITQANLVKDGTVEGLTLGTQVNNGIKNLQVFLPESPLFIQQSPALYTRLVRESNLLVVAAPPQYRLTAEDQQVIESLMEDMLGFWPLLPVDELSPDTQIPEEGWWQQFKPQVYLPFKLLTTHISAPLPDYLLDADHALRRAIQLSLLQQKQFSAVEAMSGRYEQELLQLENRKKRETRKVEPTTKITTDNHAWLTVRNQLADGIADIIRNLQHQYRKSELPNAAGIQTLKQHLESLSEADLLQEPNFKSIKLSLSPAYVQNLTAVLAQMTRQQLVDDLHYIRQQIRELSEHIAPAARDILGFSPALKELSVAENDVYLDLREIINVELRYQGERPKRGLVARLSEGRKTVFMIFMAITLLSYMGVTWIRKSPWLGFVIAPLFIGSVVYTFYSWKQEDAHFLNKELTKVKEELLNTVKRLMMEINRIKHQQLSLQLDQLKKHWLQQLDTLNREQQQRITYETEQEAAKAKARLQTIDNQLREWQQHRFKVQQLVSGAARLTQPIKDLVASLAKP